jgi:hypothetical protein
MFRQGFSKDQMVASASSVKDMLARRKTEIIGDNTYLNRQYGSGPQRGDYRQDTRNGQTATYQFSGKKWVLQKPENLPQQQGQ